jgi:mannose-6-phosphate isomerase-like protein (cupin superfamily)
MRLCPHASGFLPLAVLVLAWAAPPPAAPGDEVPPGVQVVKGAAIADKIERAAPSPGGRGGVIAEDEDWRVHATERDAPGLAEMHEGDTDVWYVLAGGGTLVTGGTIVDAAITGPGEHRGPAIRGGTDIAIATGDLISIRPRVPHWIKAVDGRLRYLTVKVHGGPSRGRRRASSSP